MVCATMCCLRRPKHEFATQSQDMSRRNDEATNVHNMRPNSPGGERKPPLLCAAAVSPFLVQRVTMSRPNHRLNVPNQVNSGRAR